MRMRNGCVQGRAQGRVPGTCLTPGSPSHVACPLVCVCMCVFLHVHACPRAPPHALARPYPHTPAREVLYSYYPPPCAHQFLSI